MCRLLSDYSPFIVPNSLSSTLSGHTGNIKSLSFVGPSGAYLVSGSSYVPPSPKDLYPLTQ